MSFLNKKLITTKNNTIMKTKNIFSSELTSVLNVQNKGVISIAQIYHEHELNLNLISVHHEVRKRNFFTRLFNRINKI